MSAQGKAKRATAILVAALGKISTIFVGRAASKVYRRGAAEAEIELALFRPRFRVIGIPSK